MPTYWQRKDGSNSDALDLIILLHQTLLKSLGFIEANTLQAHFVMVSTFSRRSELGLCVRAYRLRRRRSYKSFGLSIMLQFVGSSCQILCATLSYCSTMKVSHSLDNATAAIR